MTPVVTVQLLIEPFHLGQLRISCQIQCPLFVGSVFYGNIPHQKIFIRSDIHGLLYVQAVFRALIYGLARLKRTAVVIYLTANGLIGRAEGFFSLLGYIEIKSRAVCGQMKHTIAAKATFHSVLPPGKTAACLRDECVHLTIGQVMDPGLRKRRLQNVDGRDLVPINIRFHRVASPLQKRDNRFMVSTSSV